MPTQEIEFVLRDAAKADREFLQRLFAAVHQEEFAPLGLREPERGKLLSLQARAQAEGYAREFPQAHDRLVLMGGLAVRPVGRVLISREAEADHLVDLALLPSVQGRGLGGRLLRQVQDEAASRGVPVRLYTRAAGRALALYVRLGFQAAGVRGPDLLLEWGPEELRDPEPVSAQEPGKSQPAALGLGWKRRVQQEFHVELQDGTQASLLRLVGFEWQGPENTNRFRLLLEGEAGWRLSQGTYTLHEKDREPGNGRGEELFLVPVGQQGGTVHYEAIFNS